MTEPARPANAGDLSTLMSAVRARAAADKRVFADPAVKAWCVRRWRYLFLSEAVKDETALDFASRIFDKRPARQRIAEQYLQEGANTWRDEQPESDVNGIASTTLLICPGLVNGLLPERDFRDDLLRLEQRFGMRTLRSDSHPIRGCEANVADIMRALDEGKGRDATAKLFPDAAARIPGEVLVLGYSKGAPDFLTTLVKRPEVKSRVKAFFTWAGAIGGSQIADDLALKLEAMGLGRNVAKLRPKLKGFVHSFMSASADARLRLDEIDALGAVRDLTTAVRQVFLVEHSLTLDQLAIPMFTFRGVTRLGDVPLSQRGGFKLLDKIEPQSDMQVAGSRSKLPIPMATELAVFRAHHWDMAHPAFRKRRWFNNTYHPFPRTAALTAMVQLAAELGLVS
jgi:hypothetical protein